MNATREEVAQRAGVSETTVSFVFSKKRHVSEKLTYRVLKAAKELDYSPDMIASSMVTKNTKTIGILTDDIGSPLQMEVIKGIQEAAMNMGYFVNVCNGTYNLEKYIENFISRRVDGVYIATISNTVKEKHIQKLIDKGINVIVNSVNDSYGNRVCGLELDMIDGMDKIVKHLSALNHKNIAYLSAFDEKYLDDKRLNGFKMAMKKYQNNIKPYICMQKSHYESNIETGIMLAEKMLDEKINITALICTNDLMAFGAIKVLTERNIKIPQDVSVVGIDNIMFSSIFNPALTTLNHNAINFGKRIFEILYNNITNKITRKELFEPDLIIRESCKEIL